VEQVAQVTSALTHAGILVHAYLMYGFPTQTMQETVDALERVRQLFEMGCIQSAYWHRFSATVHSPVGKNPEAFKIRILSESGPHSPESGPHSGQDSGLRDGGRKLPIFARNDLAFEDPSGVDHESLGEGLKRALYNYMHGVGLDQPVHRWFAKEINGVRVPKARVDEDLVHKALTRSVKKLNSSSRSPSATRKSSSAH
jgi:hypothetical protein